MTLTDYYRGFNAIESKALINAVSRLYNAIGSCLRPLMCGYIDLTHTIRES